MKRKEFWIRVPSACDMTEPHHITNVGIKNFWEDSKTIHVVDMDSFNRLLEEARAMREAIEFTVQESGTSSNYNKKCRNVLDRFDKFLKDDV